MLSTPRWSLLMLLLVLPIYGCVTAPSSISIMAVKSNGVERIPIKLGIYPFLSTPLSGSGYGYFSPRANVKEASLTTTRMGDNVAITPPANTEMLITQDSQMMTDLVSASLSSHGFSLKQLPVEMQDDKNAVANEHKSFYISMNLLNDLRTNYGVEALALCDAFFMVVNNYGAPPEKRVVSANIKIIDTMTLDVLAQVNLPYVAEGINFNEAATQISLSLARLADMDVKSKGVSQ